MSEALTFLQSRFPKCFKPMGEERPLVLDILKALREHYQQESWPISLQQCYKALEAYMSTPSYLHAIITDAPRVNLEGKITGCVNYSEQQRAEAQLNLAEFGIAVTSG